MRILIVHNYYGSSAPSGENRVFEAEKAMLERAGHEVFVFTRDSDDIRSDGKAGGGLPRRIAGLLKGALCAVANPFAARALRREILRVKPDIVHFHNVFPLISPLAVRAAHRHAPVVMTLHNYRMVCAAGIPSRKGRVCDACFRECGKGKRRLNALPALWSRCYRGGFLATLPLACSIRLYRRKLSRWVDRFIVLSDFQKGVCAACGIPEERISVKGNFIPPEEMGDGDIPAKKERAVYAGRLSAGKGLETLIRAWKIVEERRLLPGAVLELVGDGDRRGALERLARERGVTSLRFAGFKPPAETRAIIRESRVLVLPSECWETFGLSAAEAMAGGTAVAVSDLGALPGLTESGRFGEVFHSGDPNGLADAIVRAFARRDYETVRAYAREKYSETANLARLLEIYRACLEGMGK